MARIAFFDPITWDYTVDTPYERPLSGTQSALCYLAVALVKAGHTVALVNHTTSPGTHRGVQTFSIKNLGWSFFRQVDIVVVVNTSNPWLVKNLRRAVAPATRLALWCHHADDQLAIRDLASAETRDRWDAFVMLSEWQAGRFAHVFGIDRSRVAILRNAIGPAFEALFRPGESIGGAKEKPLRLAYTSTPYRGLDLLLDVFPTLCEEHAGLRLDVYSDMKVQQAAARDERYRSMYERCRTMAGATHIGSLPQPELARRLKATAVLAYPSTFAETSCIAALEALAAGCQVVTCDLGALAETTMGFARMVPHSRDRSALAAAYRHALAEVLNELAEAGAEREDYLARQVATVIGQATWPRRAREWSDWMAAQLSQESRAIGVRHSDAR